MADNAPSTVSSSPPSRNGHARRRAPLPTTQSLRQFFDSVRSDYRAARETRFTPRPTGTNYYGTGADYHYRFEHDYYTLIELARNLERDDKVLGAGIRRLAVNVLQSGFKLEPRTDSESVNRLFQSLWEADTDDGNAIDYSGEYDFHQTEQLLLRRLIVDGDVGLLPLRDGRIQLFEAHRLRSPRDAVQFSPTSRTETIHGVERFINGRRLRYWVTVTDRTATGFDQTISPVRGIPAYRYNELTNQEERNFFHLYFPQRITQTRGVTALNPALETAQISDDLQLAKLVQAQASSYYVMAHNIPLESDEYWDSIEAEASHQQDLEPGTEFWPRYKGETLEGVSANVPNPEFFDHNNLNLTFLSINLDLPLTLFLLDAGKKNFSGQRFELDQAKMSFRHFQRCFANIYHKRYYRFRILYWADQIPEVRAAVELLGSRAFDVEVQYPAWPYIEPLTEVQAESLEVANSFSAPSEIVARRGKRWAQVVDSACRDRADLIQCALDWAQQLNQHPWVQEHPEERVTWREIAHHPLPQGLQMQLDMDKQAATVPSDTEEE